MKNARLNNPVIKGMALALFADAFSDAAEEAGWFFPAGAEIMEYLPDEIHPACIQAAEKLWGLMTKDLELLGHYAAMEYMGHGVGLERFDELRSDMPYGQSVDINCEYTEDDFRKCGLYPMEEDDE